MLMVTLRSKVEALTCTDTDASPSHDDDIPGLALHNVLGNTLQVKRTEHWWGRGRCLSILACRARRGMVQAGEGDSVRLLGHRAWRG